MKPFELALRLRSYYGEQGLTVYDRRDRWVEEHKRCKSEEHDLRMEGSIEVKICIPTGAVLISSDDGYGSSRCGRCRTHISAEQLLAFIENDHLCAYCMQETDSEYAQTLVEMERWHGQQRKKNAG